MKYKFFFKSMYQKIKLKNTWSQNDSGSSAKNVLETEIVSVQWHSIHLLYSAYQSGGMGKKLFQTLVVLHQILLNLFTEASRANRSGSVSHHGWYSSTGSQRTRMQCPKLGREVTVILSAFLTAHLTFLQSGALQPSNHTDTAGQYVACVKGS